jgi:hypothetical protein
VGLLIIVPGHSNYWVMQWNQHSKKKVWDACSVLCTLVDPHKKLLLGIVSSEEDFMSRPILYSKKQVSTVLQNA